MVEKARAARVALVAAGCIAFAAPTLAQSAPTPPVRPQRSTEQPGPRAPAPERAGGVDTLAAALQHAFRANPDILAQRAAARGAAEGIPIARSAALPQLSATAYAGVNATTSILRGNPINLPGGATLYQRGVALVATQTLFDGWRTQNSIGQATSQLAAAREQLRAIEQAVLLDVASTYMAVLTGQALVDVQRQNLRFLEETLATTRTRLGAGVATPTDVSQAEARVSRGRSDVNQAETDLSIARDRFARIVGRAPGMLRQPSAIDRLLPRDAASARATASSHNPAVLAAIATVRAAEANVRVQQGQMLPQVSVQAQLARDWDQEAGTRRQDQALLVGRVTVPFYQGGGPEAQTRQAREFLGQNQRLLDSARLQARSAAYAGWQAFQNASFTIRAATDEVRAGTATVDGVRRQQEAGLRTLQELLNAQQDLVTARTRLVIAQSDRLVASYTMLAAMGRLELDVIGVARPRLDGPIPQSDWGVRSDAWRDLREPTGPALGPTPEAGRR